MRVLLHVYSGLCGLQEFLVLIGSNVRYIFLRYIVLRIMRPSGCDYNGPNFRVVAKVFHFGSIDFFVEASMLNS